VCVCVLLLEWYECACLYSIVLPASAPVSASASAPVSVSVSASASVSVSPILAHVPIGPCLSRPGLIKLTAATAASAAVLLLSLRLQR
jgi:hypothetical protein